MIMMEMMMVIMMEMEMMIMMEMEMMIMMEVELKKETQFFKIVDAGRHNGVARLD